MCVTVCVAVCVTVCVPAADDEFVDANEVEYYKQMSDAVPERIYDTAMYH